MHLARNIKDDKKYFYNFFSSKKKIFGLYQEKGVFSGDEEKKASIFNVF